MNEFLGFSEEIFDSCVSSEKINTVRETLDALGSEIRPELQKLNNNLNYVVSRAKKQGSNDFNDWAWLMFTNAPIGHRGKPIKAYLRTQLTINVSNSCIYIGLNIKSNERAHFQNKLNDVKSTESIEEITTLLSKDKWIITTENDDFDEIKPKQWDKVALKEIILDPDLEWINARYDRNDPIVQTKEIVNEIIRIFKLLFKLYDVATNLNKTGTKIIVNPKEETIEIKNYDMSYPNSMTEKSLIEHVHDSILRHGFTFSPQQIINYYLSLKTKPFVILTGISGTGKTKITELFAEAVCTDSEKQYLLLPVRPDWNDDKYLLGYYNPLTKLYQSTQFLNFIIKASNDLGNPYFVCLDEMNLARVEYYFSTFLSALESKSKMISLHSSDNEVKTEDGKEIPSRIPIPNNLFFTGTVNMDETTYRFSPKVLDRANTIEFNDIDLLQLREDETSTPTNSDLPASFNKYFLNDEVRMNGITSDAYSKWETENWGELVGILDTINKEALEEHNLHFGYRIRDEIMRYLYFAQELYSDGFTENTAIDFQIKQKVLPKIKGPESIRPALESMEELAEKYPYTSSKIKQMLEALSNGYTDFYQ